MVERIFKVIHRLADLADLFRQFRNATGLNQEGLAEKIGPPVNRSHVSHLEQGLRVPPPQVLAAIGQYLRIPEETWRAFANEGSQQRHEFEATLSELVGRSVGLGLMDNESVQSCESEIASLFSGGLTSRQSFDIFNSVLVFYAVPRMSLQFFQRYFSAATFQSVEAFARDVRLFQVQSIRIFSTFGEAYRRMNGADSLEDITRTLESKSAEKAGFSERTVWGNIGDFRKLPEDKLEFLGYISANEYAQQKAKRELLARYLRELAELVRKDGAIALDTLSEKRKRKIDSLMKELKSTFAHTPISGLFAPNPADLDAEAARMLRDEKDQKEMERVQRQALSNLSHYISSDYMDVYVATSMRTNSDFISVNRFVDRLFSHRDITPLRLRYFNPTQSWIKDRVAKGLVEALMLRRASVTLYMAQKTDSFGKDSEASVALGQGKPVIVYVPKLRSSDGLLDSEDLANSNEGRLRSMLLASGLPTEELDDLDRDGLFRLAVAAKLAALSDSSVEELVHNYWADFALLDESGRIRRKDTKEEARLREEYTLYVTAISSNKAAMLTKEVRHELEQIFQALTETFEIKRARMFKEVHPLALQLIVSSGVLNGILVSRTVDSCAALLKGLLLNDLELELDTADDNNYRLLEKSTKSTIRVISRNQLLSNALDTVYGRT